MAEARFAALGVIDPATGAPQVSRIAVARGPDGLPISLISDLAAHAGALAANPSCSLLLGEPGDKGDPLTHPRLTLQARASFVRHGEAGHAPLRATYLAQNPKAKLYIDFADFSLVLFQPRHALLNGGFGKAFRLTADDLTAG